MTSNPLKTIPYHVPEALLRILQEQAREENLSTSAYITRVLCFHHFGHKNDFVEEGKIINSPFAIENRECSNYFVNLIIRLHY